MMVSFLTLLWCSLVEPSVMADEAVGVHEEHARTKPSSELRFARTLDPPSSTVHFDAWVYGYYAWWSGTVHDLPWDRLTHVAIFDVKLESDGSLSETQNWTSVAADAVSLAEPYGVKVHLTVTAFSGSIMNAVLSDPARRQATIDALVELVDAHGAHGVAVDFEGMLAQNRAHLVQFVESLAARVDEVTVATPAVDWNGAYDYAGLAKASDGLFIMGYDYHYRGGDPGPVAPLRGGSPWGMYGLEWSIEDHLDRAPASRVILGLPLYGYSWPTTGTQIPGASTGTADSVVFANAVGEATNFGREWNATTHTPYYFPSSTRQTWYDDTESLEAKILLALDHELLGIGFWAVNYEGGDPEFWDMVGALTQTSTPTPDDPPDGDGSTTDDLPSSEVGTGHETHGSSEEGGGGTQSLPMPSAESESDGCACHTGRPDRGIGVLALVVLLLARRRVVDHRPPVR